MRILVVEDNEELAEFLKASLEAECFAVDIALNGEDGIRLGRINGYDLVILDNMLPKKNGREVCISIKDKHKDLPILMLSVKADISTKVELLNVGADDYMVKPFSLTELLARIRALLRRPEAVIPDILEIEDVVIDSRNHSVRKAGKEIRLTRKEFMLLEYLARRKDCAVSRGEISEHVWDMGLDPFSNTIEAHIRNLRRKIGLNPSGKSYITTIPGRGYRLEH